MSNNRASETLARAQEAYAERLDDSVTKRKCKHPSNVEFALFFYKLQSAAQERAEGTSGNNQQWILALGKVAGSVCKLPSRIRSLEHANAVTGVGEKTLALFRKYLDAFPPMPPTDMELHADVIAAQAKEAAKEKDKQRKKEERLAKKRKAVEEKQQNEQQDGAGASGGGDAGGTYAQHSAGRAAGEWAGGDHLGRPSAGAGAGGDDGDDIIILDSPTPTRAARAAPAPAGLGATAPPRQHQQHRGGIHSPTPVRASAPGATPAPDAAPGPAPAPTSDQPPAKKARKAKATPAVKKPWEPGLGTAAFALLVTLHRLDLRGDSIVKKKLLMDEVGPQALLDPPAFKAMHWTTKTPIYEPLHPCTPVL
jgi:hypothetical protein